MPTLEELCGQEDDGPPPNRDRELDRLRELLGPDESKRLGPTMEKLSANDLWHLRTFVQQLNTRVGKERNE